MTTYICRAFCLTFVKILQDTNFDTSMSVSMSVMSRWGKELGCSAFVEPSVRPVVINCFPVLLPWSAHLISMTMCITLTYRVILFFIKFEQQCITYIHMYIFGNAEAKPLRRTVGGKRGLEENLIPNLHYGLTNFIEKQNYDTNSGNIF